MKKLWGGRFKKKADAGFERFSASFIWDRRLLPYDLEIDAAHVKALKKCGVLSAAEASTLSAAISDLAEKTRSGRLRLNPKAEDVHSAIQEALRKKIGPLADKLHTARSRNDLVSQSTRLYCRAECLKIIEGARRLKLALVRQAEDCQEVLVPGMTHLQNAQVVSQAHIFLAYVQMIERAQFRLRTALTLFDVCVLGSGALAGVSYDLDQKMIARELGLSRITQNSYDVSGDRDFVLNFLSSITLLGIQFSRIAEDLLVGQARGGAVVELDEAFCTGSSMMPQKKNADFLELARGASAVFAANFAGILLLLKGLPSSYNRDLQWDKKFLFDSVERCEELLEIFIRVVKTLKINRERARELLKDESIYATDLADYLVSKGTPFARAHEEVGRLVSFAEAEKTPLSKIGLDLIQKFAPLAEGGVYAIFDARHSVRMKKTAGSAHPAEVRREIRYWKRKLKK
ncbi:MAG: argininosuccinate lyase [Candidatus Omnitrophica bacterium]|nr:argininosuccinate lyase [Candidatus Omnitrophota bacterium]